MIHAAGNLGKIRALIREAFLAKVESFSLKASDWLAALEVLRASRPLMMKGDYRGGWRHPWQLSPSWNPALEQWQVAIQPGFVNAQETEARIPAAIAPPDTRERLSLPATGGEGTVDAWLTESPAIPLSFSALRSVGPDGAATGATGDGLNRELNFEPVPEYFSALGVGEPPNLAFDAFGATTIGAAFNTKTRRLLRAVDVTLTVRRPAAKTEWTTGTGSDGTFAQFDIIYVNDPLASDPPQIGFTKKFDPLEAIEIDGNPLTDYADAPFDVLQLGTVWLMSPPGAREGSEPDATWRGFGENFVFWNLNHSTNRLIPATATPNLTFPMPLAFGVGAALVNQVLASHNDALDLAAELLRKHNLKGKFWTT